MPSLTPFSFEPTLRERAERPPEGPEWCYELKLDGYRAIAARSGNRTQLWSRNKKDFNRRFPSVSTAIGELPNDTIIHGEIVALDPAGKPSFGLLQGFGSEASALVLYAFDLLMLRGKDVRLWPLEERRELGQSNVKLKATQGVARTEWWRAAHNINRQGRLVPLLKDSAETQDVRHPLRIRLLGLQIRVLTQLDKKSTRVRWSVIF